MPPPLVQQQGTCQGDGCSQCQPRTVTQSTDLLPYVVHPDALISSSNCLAVPPWLLVDECGADPPTHQGAHRMAHRWHTDGAHGRQMKPMGAKQAPRSTLQSRPSPAAGTRTASSMLQLLPLLLRLQALHALYVLVHACVRALLLYARWRDVGLAQAGDVVAHQVVATLQAASAAYGHESCTACRVACFA